ncbi:MAG: SCO family protein [Balneolaceae bacterium]
MKRVLQMAVLVPVLCLPDARPAEAQLNRGNPAILDDIGIEEMLGDTIPTDLQFTNSDGETVTIAELMEEGKPVLLNPLYYDCPMLCNVIVEGVHQVIRELRWSPGTDYTVISFSIDPGEPHTLAAENKERYLSDLDRPGAADGWHFLTGGEDQIRQLTDAVGFKYKKEEQTGEYIHSAAITFLSPDGVVTRYLYGTKFAEFDLRNALYEAADGHIGTPVDQAVLYCFTYDPASESYVPVAFNIMKLGGLATVLFLGIFLGIFWLKERRLSSQSQNFEFLE